MQLIYKPVGITPLQAVQRFKLLFPEYSKTTVSYAGRLDPMAEGLLILLTGKENKNRTLYENLPKTYEFTVLSGIETDTYDILGKITSSYSPQQEIGNLKLEILDSFIGKRIQLYPPYSSKTILGRPLYWWARHGRLQEIHIPCREIEIYSFALLSLKEISPHDLRYLILERIQKVQGNFRQKEILELWSEFLKNNEHSSFPLLNCRIQCSSGTYIRSIANEAGKLLGTGAIAVNIKRTTVGNYLLEKAIRI